MSFLEQLRDKEYRELTSWIERCDTVTVERALAASELDAVGFAALLSPAAGRYLEEMAQRAQQLTLQNFGRVIVLYAPLYVANYCENGCLYCGFKAGNAVKRRRLTLEEVTVEAEAIAATGIKHVLLLTGESRRHSPVSYIRNCVDILVKRFSSIGIEVYPLEEAEYRDLVSAGVDSLTLYQETYDEKLYAVLHPFGPKRDFGYRLEGPARGCRAGMRAVTVGALLGLAPWRQDGFWTGLHARYLQDEYPEVDIGVSLPRLRPHVGAFQPKDLVSDAELVQYMLALRLLLPRARMVLSTRERASLRDNLIGLGITHLSAGSRTQVGGYGSNDPDEGQFEIADHRSVAEVKKAIEAKGYQPVFKDWQVLV